MRLRVAIVAVILALLAGLVLVGVVRLREVSARMNCGNNLHQLGIGVHTYHDTMGRLPPLVGTGDDPRSVFGAIFPYLEATPIRFSPGDSPLERYYAHSSTTFTFRGKDGAAGSYGGGLANQRCILFLCPADATADGLRDVPLTLPDGGTGHFATGSYAANRLLPWGTKSPAVGSPQLVVFAERPQVCRTASGADVHNLWGVGFDCPQSPAFTPLPYSATPFQRTGRERLCDPWLPGSPHADGMQVVMGDASVRLFSYRTTPREFWSACVSE